MKARTRIFTILQAYKREMPVFRSQSALEHYEKQICIRIPHGWGHVDPDITPDQVQALNRLAEKAYETADRMREWSEICREVEKGSQRAIEAARNYKWNQKNQ